jgi:hypothetical protein
MKGQWKTVEAVIGGVVIMLFVAVLSSTYVQMPSAVPLQGYRALDAVYEKGMLRAYAADTDLPAINAEVEATGYLPGYNHSVTICNETGACTGNVPDKDDVWAASMLLSGDGQYKPMEVILYIFRD